MYTFCEFCNFSKNSCFVEVKFHIKIKANHARKDSYRSLKFIFHDCSNAFRQTYYRSSWSQMFLKIGVPEGLELY